MMKLEILETLKDDELRSIISRAEELLRQHDRALKEKALKDARTILEAAGLSLRDIAPKGRNERPGKSPVYHGGRCYQHPERRELVWTAKGQKPNWLRELEKEGGRAVEQQSDLQAQNNAATVIKS
ncbi:MAG TPA: H-NS histone family protein [Candidatus Angelobacter sp.]|nr:H-NS histone family protein [Candidatus Angelobacter sp.]